MRSLSAQAIRGLFKRELLPARIRWWFIADGLDEWLRLLASELRPALGTDGAERVLAESAAAVWLRRSLALASQLDPQESAQHSPSRRSALVMGGLYRVASHPKLGFAFQTLGGVPVSFHDHLSSERLIAGMSSEARWLELTHHLGELLIDLTERLPGEMPRANATLGRICFDAGVRVGQKMKKAFGLRKHPSSAIEVLRMSEYLFRVNPEHWSGITSADSPSSPSAYLEGTACPWYSAKGWSGAHCGIFGQFQSGISSVYGMRYQLTSTIPKHGGTTCRVDLKPITLRQRRPANPSAAKAGGGHLV